MGLAFCASFFTALSFMIILLTEAFSALYSHLFNNGHHLLVFIEEFQYVPFLRTCVAAMKPSKLPGVWASEVDLLPVLPVHPYTE